MPSTLQPAKEYDVVIVGAGPAGLMASTCLTTYGFSVLHIDDRPHPTTAGRADGLQPRTLEVLRNIGGLKIEEGKSGLAKRMISQGVRVQEVCFWDPTPTKKLARTSRAPSCPDWIDVADPYTLLLHQGLIENSFLAEINARRQHLPHDKFVRAPDGGVFRPFQFVTCKTDLDPSVSHPVETTIEHGETKQSYTVRSKYLLGNDGARSMVRKAIAGGGEKDGTTTGKIRMEGDTSDLVWAVIDMEVKTDFPDLLSKCMIHSKEEGSIMIIPRENNLVRFYVQLQQTADGVTSSIERSKGTQDICLERARAIFQPFTLEFGRVDWFSIYQIGQRIASRYTLDERVFLGGDATHTHSPKAGQGMNISMLDMYSLAWKINLVEKGLADRSILLPTYESERKGIAEELLRFDSAYSRLFSGRNPTDSQLTTDTTKAKANGAVDAELFIETFKKNCLFTSGCGAFYSANVLNATDDSELVKGYQKQGVFNPVGTKLICGQRLLPGLVTRAIDANRVRIQQEVKMNGAFRIHVLAGNFESARANLKAFDDYLDSPNSFTKKHRGTKGAFSSIIEGKGVASQYIEHDKRVEDRNPFFTFLTIFSNPHTEWDIEDIPSFHLRSYRDQVYSDDVPDHRVPEAGRQHPLHVKYGVDVNKGAIIVVRPDSYVGAVVSLNEDGFEALNKYFAGFLI
ncbi:phenol 2-monooxygenase [Meredithblackwellia eburnea MCA 4105]